MKEAEKRNGWINNTNSRTGGGGQFSNSRIWSNWWFYLAASTRPCWKSSMKRSGSRCPVRSCLAPVCVYFHIHHTRCRRHEVRIKRLIAGNDCTQSVLTVSGQIPRVAGSIGQVLTFSLPVQCTGTTCDSTDSVSLGSFFFCHGVHIHFC